MSVPLGSSPLTRGKLLRRPRIHQTSRLIPAHAGKTSISPQASTHRSAHPRSRGENYVLGADEDAFTGSSPLTRGKRGLLCRCAHEPGLIPAHAGKTWKASRAYCRAWAHPRSRGENLIAPEMIDTSAGSSPLTRGKLDAVEELVSERRLIPAHAGKTTGRMCRSTCSTAHPRSRGENVRTAQYSPPAGGSSPLTRGKPAAPRSWGRTSRLIPAHAGKTACP